MGKERDFRKETVEEVWEIVRDIEKNSDTPIFDDIADWFTVDWDISEHLGEVNEYYKHMVDNNDITSAKFKRILDRVKYVDTDYHNRFVAIGEMQKAIATKMDKMASLLSPNAMSMSVDEYKNHAKAIDHNYNLEKQEAKDKIAECENTEIELEDPKWYEKLRNESLGFYISLERAGTELLLSPVRLVYYVGDKMTGWQYNETLTKCMDSLEERYIVKYLVTDNESYYKGRRDGDIIIASLGKLAEWAGMATIVAGGTISGGGTVMMATGVGAVPGAAVTFTGGIVVGAGTATWAIGKVITIPLENDLRKMSNNIYRMESESGVPENQLVDESSGKIGEVGETGLGSVSGDSNAIKSKFVNKIKNIRSKMPNTRLSKRGNMAVADVDIPEIKDSFVAHSGIDTKIDKGADLADFSLLKPEEQRIFNTYVEDRYPRYHDTEAKILEDIASNIKDPNVKGNINLYSELPCCQSCSNIIMEFRRKFPNIKLNVYVE